MSISFPRQGEIYLIKALRPLGDTKKRPGVVVSNNVRNELKNSVLIVPFTSDLTSGETLTRIELRASEGGLEADSLALCDNISAIVKAYLDRGPYGEISLESLLKIQRGIQISIGVF
jgi:mRNA interferase MazF